MPSHLLNLGLHTRVILKPETQEIGPDDVTRWESDGVTWLLAVN